MVELSLWLARVIFTGAAASGHVAVRQSGTQPGKTEIQQCIRITMGINS